MFKFNKNYKDLEQVKEFYPAFLKIYNQLKAEEKYTYNDSFKGKIKGIEGEDEATAIYLLQGLGTQESRENKINNLLKNGYNEIKDGEGTQKFDNVVMVGTEHSKDSTREFEKAKIMFGDNLVRFIIPKGHRTRGLFIARDRRIFVK